MKIRFLILSLFFTAIAVGQKTFNWSDTTFQVGAKRVLNIKCCDLPNWSNVAPYYDCPYNHFTYDTVIDFLKRHPKIHIEIAAYGAGASSISNKNWSNRMALGIAEIICNKGIDSARISTMGYGDTKPIFSKSVIDTMKTQQEKNDAEIANRRFEIVIKE